MNNSCISIFETINQSDIKLSYLINLSILTAFLFVSLTRKKKKSRYYYSENCDFSRVSLFLIYGFLI